jgi:5-methylcytosine-specific restriction protein B
MLIEPDKRNEDVRLAYTGEPFFVPDNVYIIGMMNTADRSLAMIDYALRRRFSFVTLRTQLNNPKFEALLAKNSDPGIKRLAECVCRLNEVIRNDVGLGEGFEIGHSYFCGRNLNAADIVEFELKPLLKEYWYDDMEKVEEWSLNLDRSIG